jgi:hypothetical protein
MYRWKASPPWGTTLWCLWLKGGQRFSVCPRQLWLLCSMKRLTEIQTLMRYLDTIGLRSLKRIQRASKINAARSAAAGSLSMGVDVDPKSSLTPSVTLKIAYHYQDPIRWYTDVLIIADFTCPTWVRWVTPGILPLIMISIIANGNAPTTLQTDYTQRTRTREGTCPITLVDRLRDAPELFLFPLTPHALWKTCSELRAAEPWWWANPA